MEVEAGNQTNMVQTIQVKDSQILDPVMEVGHSILDRANLVLKHPVAGPIVLGKVLLITALEELLDGHQMLERVVPVLVVGKTNLPKVRPAPIKIKNQSTGMDS